MEGNLLDDGVAARPRHRPCDHHAALGWDGPLGFERIQEVFARLSSYAWWEVAIELAIIWLIVYAVVRFVQGTRAAGALKGLLLVVTMATIVALIFGRSEAFQRLAMLHDRLLALVAIALVVIFQPELRRALVRLGEARLLRSSPSELARVVNPLVEACGFLSKARFGAIIVIERDLGLRGLIEGGTDLDAELSARLLQTIFYPGSALHDLAVVVRGARVRAAGVQLPLAEPSDLPDPGLGSRHRAAVGLTKDSDAVVIVVSEETGAIRVSLRGKLSDPMTAAEMGERVVECLRGERKGPKTDRAAEPEPDLEAEAEEAFDRMQAPGDTGGSKASSKPVGSSTKPEVAS